MTIGIWGDSITFGSGDSEALGWVGRLRKSIAADDSIQIYNFGICGETSKDILKRFNVEAEAIEPEHVVFAVGINDSKYEEGSSVSKVDLSEYVENIESLITEAGKFSAQITLIGSTLVAENFISSNGSRFLNQVIKEYNNALQKVGDKYGLTFIDTFGILDPKTDLSDRLHPNASGYKKMFEVISSKIRFS